MDFQIINKRVIKLWKKLLWDIFILEMTEKKAKDKFKNYKNKKIWGGAMIQMLRKNIIN